MDLLVEKLDGSRYYLSQYKVLITDFEESAPSVTRNSKQLDQRNGNIDFGGWHTDKTITITGYYRADDMDEEEMLREKLYALLSDPDGYYITQLKTTPNVAMERPGDTSGGYYDKLSNYPSHKRFLVYTEAPEMELVGNVNGTLLYKLTAEFKTMKLPYGETPAVDVAIDSPYKDVPVNLLQATDPTKFQKDNSRVFADHTWLLASGGNGTSELIETQDRATKHGFQINGNTTGNKAFQQHFLFENKVYTFSVFTKIVSDDATVTLLFRVWGSAISLTATNPKLSSKDWVKLTWAIDATKFDLNANPSPLMQFGITDAGSVAFSEPKLELGTTASPWSPNPADPEYSSWYYGLNGKLSVPYHGTVPCNQLEQGFEVEFVAKQAASSLSFKIDDTELTYIGAVAVGDVFVFSGFSYTQNGLSIVSKTNKAYFILQPDKPNRITCNVPGTVRILGFQNLYA